MWLWLGPLLFASVFALFTDFGLKSFERWDVNVFMALLFLMPAAANAFALPLAQSRFRSLFQAVLATSFVLSLVFFAMSLSFWYAVHQKIRLSAPIFQTIFALFIFIVGFFLVRLFEARRAARDFDFSLPRRKYVRILLWIGVPQGLLLAFLLGSESLHRPTFDLLLYASGAFGYSIWVTLAAFAAILFFTRFEVFRKHIGFLILCATAASFFFGCMYMKFLMPSIRVSGLIVGIFPCFFSTGGVTFMLLNFTRDRTLKRLDLSFSKKVSEYHRLRQQVSPHFFFNNLNMLLSFIESDPKKAVEFGQNLSNVYRKFLKTDDEDFVPLSTELEFIYEYIEIFRAKYGNTFYLGLGLALEKNAEGYIVAHSLQEIIDNIFKHNIFEDGHPIKVEIFIEDGNLIVRNSMRAKRNVVSDQTGLENIKKRHELLAAPPFSYSGNGETFVVSLPILKLQ